MRISAGVAAAGRAMSRAHARLAPRHHHRPRHRPDPRLGHVVLFSRGAGAADCRRHRLVAGLGGQRHLDRAAGRGADRAEGRRDHRPARRPAGARGLIAALCGRALLHRACAKPAGVICSAGSCSAAAWAPGSTTRCSRRSASSTAGRADADHQSHAVRRLCLDGVLAAQRVSGGEFRLARRLPGLCGVASDRLAAVADGGDAAAGEIAGRPAGRRGRGRTGAIAAAPLAARAADPAAARARS